MDVHLAHAAAIEAVAERLRSVGIVAAAVESRWLVEHVVATAPPGAVDAPLLVDGVLADRLQALVVRRGQGEPLQLLLGRWPFRTIELELVPGVFVPRQETEVVAGAAIEQARRLGPGVIVAEPCTGSGAIACSLLAEVPGVEVYATDRDPEAVALAGRNLAAVAEMGGGAPRARVLEGDLLAPLPRALRGRLDLLVANPPYLPDGDRDRLAPEVADHDPPAALFGGSEGHEVVDRLLATAGQWLRPGGVAIIEIDDRRGEEVCEVARDLGFEDVHLLRDLAGRDRAIVATMPDHPSRVPHLAGRAGLLEQ